MKLKKSHYVGLLLLNKINTSRDTKLEVFYMKIIIKEVRKELNKSLEDLFVNEIIELQ